MWITVLQVLLLLVLDSATVNKDNKDDLHTASAISKDVKLKLRWCNHSGRKEDIHLIPREKVFHVKDRRRKRCPRTRVKAKYQQVKVVLGLISLIFILTPDLLAESEKKVVCFYAGWSSNRPGSEMFSPRDIDPRLCTHLVYAYAGINDDDKLTPLDSYLDKDKGGYAKFSSLKAFNKNLQTILAVGRGLSRKMSIIAADERRRRNFAKNALMFLRVNRFSGINLSWQYPGLPYGRAEDKINYVLLLQALREEFEQESNITGKPSLLISMDVPHSIKVLNGGFDIPGLSKYLDFINVFAFNYRFPVEAEMSHHAPLYSIAGQTDHGYESQFNVDFTIKHLLSLGVQRDKIILGIPTYGRTLILYQPDKSLSDTPEVLGTEENLSKSESSLPYYEICKMSKAEGWKVENPSPRAVGPYAHWGNFLVGYDDPNAVKMKAQYAAKEGLGGIMFWTIDFDDFKGECHGKRFPLIEAGKEALLNTAIKSETSNNLENDKMKTYFHFNTATDSTLEPSTKTSTQDDNITVIQTISKKAIADSGKTISPTAGFSQSGVAPTEAHRQFSTEDQRILEQLILLVKKLGGVTTLQRLLSDPGRNFNRGSPILTNHMRTYSSDFYGREVASVAVASPPLFFRAAPTPIVLTNFTINIEELKLDSNLFRGPYPLLT